MLRVGRVGAATEGEQAATAQESLRHFAASFGKPVCLTREEAFAQAIALEQPFLDLSREFHSGRHKRSGWSTASAVQGSACGEAGFSR